MNIKSPETQRLAHELAEVTGETLTDAVTESLRERLQRVRTQRRGSLADRLLEIGRDCASHMQQPLHAAEIDELLYDERGLPR